MNFCGQYIWCGIFEISRGMCDKDSLAVAMQLGGLIRVYFIYLFIEIFIEPVVQTCGAKCQHSCVLWNGNVVILTNFRCLLHQKLSFWQFLVQSFSSKWRILTTSDSASDANFVKMMTFQFLVFYCEWVQSEWSKESVYVCIQRSRL